MCQTNGNTYFTSYKPFSGTSAYDTLCNIAIEFVESIVSPHNGGILILSVNYLQRFNANKSILPEDLLHFIVCRNSTAHFTWNTEISIRYKIYLFIVCMCFTMNIKSNQLFFFSYSRWHTTTSSHIIPCKNCYMDIIWLDQNQKKSFWICNKINYIYYDKKERKTSFHWKEKSACGSETLFW